MRRLILKMNVSLDGFVGGAMGEIDWLFKNRSDDGGAGLARSLVASGLIDEYQLLVHPVALGHGLALFSELARPLPLSVVETVKFTSGVIAHVLRPE